MDIKDFIEKVKVSSISEDRKQKIINLLEKQGVDLLDIKEEIKDLIQEDIEESTTGLDLSDYKQEIEKATQKISEGLSVVENTLKEEVISLNNEMENLQSSVSELDKALDQVQIESIRTDLQK